jgi:hypothetical protein
MSEKDHIKAGQEVQLKYVTSFPYKRKLGEPV